MHRSLGRWKLLGVVSVNWAGLTVKLTNAANGYVIADAVRIEQATGVRSPPEIINVSADSMSLVSKTSAVAFSQPPANASDLVSSNALLFPASPTASTSPGQSTVATTTQMTVTAQASRATGAAKSGAMDGASTRLDCGGTDSLSSGIDLLASEERDRLS